MGLEPGAARRVVAGVNPPPVFKTGSSSGRMASVVKYKAAVPQLRELDSNQHYGVQSAASCH